MIISTPQGWKAWLKLLLPLTLSIGLLVALKLLGPELLSQKTLSEFLRPFGKWAPLAYIGLYGVRPLTLLSGQLFTAVGGLMFGTVNGALYALAGSFVSTTVVFALARWLGRKPVRKLAGDKHELLCRLSKENGFSFGLLACLNVVIPADVMLACAAAAGARFWPTAAGALLGTIPGTVITAAFGSSLGQGRTWTTAATATGMAVSLIVGALLARRLFAKAKEMPEAAGSGGDPRSRPAETATGPVVAG